MVGALPPFYAMVRRGLLDAPNFSLWLNPDITADIAGELLLGGIDATRFYGGLVYLPITSSLWVLMLHQADMTWHRMHAQLVSMLDVAKDQSRCIEQP